MKTLIYSKIPLSTGRFSALVLALFFSLFFTAGAGNAADIYKYRQADGSMLYSQKPLKQRPALKVLHVPPPTAKQLRAQRAARHQLAQLQAKSARLERERNAQAQPANPTPPVALVERSADVFGTVAPAGAGQPPTIIADNQSPEARMQQLRAQAAQYEQMRQQLAQEQTIAR